MKLTTWLLESQEQSRAQKNQNLALSCIINDRNESLYVESTELPDNMDNPVELMSHVGDTLHLHQAVKQPDKGKLLKTMEDEVMKHQRRKHWKVVPISHAPEGEKILDFAWAMMRKGALIQVR